VTIAERKAREAYDRENPWRPMADAQPDGRVCELPFNAVAGDFACEGHRYFLDHDGNWYRIDPPARVSIHGRLR
jgi:hypothetical protein